MIGQTNGRGPLHDETTGKNYEDYKVRIDFRSLRWIPDRLIPYSLQELQSLMLIYGWPDNFDRENFRKSMLKRDQEKWERYYKRTRND